LNDEKKVINEIVFMYFEFELKVVMRYEEKAVKRKLYGAEE
jgi:hypothetical protein